MTVRGRFLFKASLSRPRDTMIAKRLWKVSNLILLLFDLASWNQVTFQFLCR